MAIQIFWDKRHSGILILEFESEWSWEDVIEAIQIADEKIAQLSERVDIILDLEASTRIPGDIMTFAREINASNEQARPNEGYRIIAGTNRAVKLIVQALQKTFSKQLENRAILFAQDLEDAVAIILSLRQEA